MQIRWVFAFMAFGSIAVNCAHAQAGSPALQEARRHLLDANVNVLTFHSVDQLFPTRRVDASGNPWVLPRLEKNLDFTYEHAGKTHPAMDVLDRTYTNALIVLKHGKIVALPFVGLMLAIETFLVQPVERHVSRWRPPHGA